MSIQKNAKIGWRCKITKLNCISDRNATSPYPRKHILPFFLFTFVHLFLNATVLEFQNELSGNCQASEWSEHLFFSFLFLVEYRHQIDLIGSATKKIKALFAQKLFSLFTCNHSFCLFLYLHQFQFLYLWKPAYFSCKCQCLHSTWASHPCMWMRMNVYPGRFSLKATSSLSTF